MYYKFEQAQCRAQNVEIIQSSVVTPPVTMLCCRAPFHRMCNKSCITPADILSVLNQLQVRAYQVLHSFFGISCLGAMQVHVQSQKVDKI